MAEQPVQVRQAQQVTRVGADPPPRIRSGRAGPGLRQRRGDRAFTAIGDPVAHHDHGDVAALGQANQELAPTPPGTGRGRHQGAPDQPRPLLDSLGGGGEPLGRPPPRRDDDAAGGTDDGRGDLGAVPGRILEPLLERGIGQRLGQPDRVRVVIEVDPTATARQIARIERHTARTGRRGLLDLGHPSHSSDPPRQFRVQPLRPNVPDGFTQRVRCMRVPRARGVQVVAWAPRAGTRIHRAL